ncbi:hypothetical protein [Sinisalibacter aestuarii]|uniref:Two-component sensor histidine kinase n=1 Tax=Sinisalibacter aestuarii TaxID=2949426 RepID=A0ABQ5LV42_9RHOB|nr:hypothetical protein [Sinisalibacter aestuarii]GKY88458.1 hypothetical protein STA1M1_23270 [Sinisalibacter aestuarii]
MSRLIYVSIVSALVGLACVIALIVMVGRWDEVAGGPLVAEMALNEVAVPAAYEINPVTIADELVARMQQRSETDMALGMLLGEKGNALMRDRALPRLVNAGVVRRMVEEMDGLGTVIAFAGYHAYAPVRVENRGDDALDDVAMTLPGAVRAETEAGAPVTISEHDDGLAALSLGRLEPGEAVAVRVWFDQTPTAVAARGAEMRLGAAGGLRGIVNLYPAAMGWNGADLQVLPWARWLIAGVLTAVGFAALAALALTLVSLGRRARVSRA